VTTSEIAEGAAASPAAAMIPLHPDQKKVLRIRTALALPMLIVPAFVLDMGPLRETALPFGLVLGLAALLGLLALVALPRRRYRAWSFREEEDELHIRHGLFFRMLTVVPFGRVQHIDVAQGPIERHYGLGTLILHTAGTRGAAVPLPGLDHEEAGRMRDRIRAKIRQDLV
jgi:uncharacterized protein